MTAQQVRRAGVAAALFVAAGLRAFALEGEVVVDATPSAALIATSGPGSPPVQAEATRITSQFALSGHAAPNDALTLSATAWALLDSLPSNNPLDVPGGRLRPFQSAAPGWAQLAGHPRAFSSGTWGRKSFIRRRASSAHP